jgi:hypothetical protein
MAANRTSALTSRELAQLILATGLGIRSIERAYRSPELVSDRIRLALANAATLHRMKPPPDPAPRQAA